MTISEDIEPEVKGRIKDSYGYIQIRKPEHRFSRYGYVREHRLVVEKNLNCTLLPWCTVHHIDGNKTNNNIENLLPMMRHEHTRIHNPRLDLTDRICDFCNTNITSIDKKGKRRWYHFLDGYLCDDCHQKLKSWTTDWLIERGIRNVIRGY